MKKTHPYHGLSVSRFFTAADKNPLKEVEYIKRDCRITKQDGSIVFEMKDFKAPKSWSQNASDIMASKYARKAGVPQYDEDGKPIKDERGNPVLGVEKGADQVIGRMTGCWRMWAEKHGYFDSKQSADAYEAEMNYMLINQMSAPNSPQWFNTGLNSAYGINGPAQGHYYADPKTGKINKSEDAYTHPQPHACFIQSVKDDLVNEGGIMDLWMREARLFKYGSGTGSNFSAVRGEGENLSGGGFSSGLMSFLKIGDRAAGAIKSGGTTRRAAKMVCLDIDHPEIESFINWKVEEEKKVAALIAAGYSSDFNGEAYATVSGQNSNNSVRISNKFMNAVENDEDFDLTSRITGKAFKTVSARKIWKQIGYAAWACADPGLQFDTTINEWHTCPKDGRINASNPCSEYMFLDDTACNLASLNLEKFFDEKTDKFNVEAMRHAIRLWTITLEISVLMAQFPSYEIAKRSYEYRTLGLGYANLGTVLMLLSVPYDSDEGRTIAAALTSILTGASYETSAEMADSYGPFVRYEHNKEDMLRVIRNHKRATYDVPEEEYEDLEVKPVGLKKEHCPKYLHEASCRAWDMALKKGEKFGFRNAQVSVIAPTGTIGLLMDCDTTGIEPDFALVKFKKLAGGGYMKIINQSVPVALKKLNYTTEQIQEILDYIVGKGSLVEAPFINWKTLKKKGLNEDELIKIEKGIKNAFGISMVFNKFIIGEEALERLDINPDIYNDPNFNFLKEIGFTDEEIEAANEFVCGAMTIEGAPYIKEKHLPVFDCANKCGRKGKRFIDYTGHIKMLGATQPFVSGSISKTINMPNEVEVKDVLEAYELSWKLGLKANAIYRDGSKLSQPLNTSSEDKKKEGKGKIEMSEVEITKKPLRRRLSNERQSITHKFSIAGHEGYFTVGLYDDGTPGEFFIKMSKEGSTLSGIMDSLALSISLNLQYGVPLEVLISKFTHSRFEPSGMTTNNEIPIVKSIMDYIGRWLALKFLSKDEAKKYHNGDLIDRAYNEGTMSIKGVMPAIKSTITIGEPQVKERDDTEARLIQVLEKAKIQPAKKAVTVGGVNSYTTPVAYQNDDAPMCHNCGSVMVRNGSCYKCLDCGETSGCS
ncbi:vitamin B12-dependent ribonucleotide reductase [Patescibacteria group bacterium]|nr:vitamin B12-dependent ribonucleotide reductase [Patescibacteria group bacterium]MBU1683384.1 vitamin B12-dependent ribonucleotide reductase [Patescibacteria group bacterium]MBU1935469.1 vitamin B12-dependent ribonucleotide reductase [Patescibacteria group bacterium]